MKHRWKLLPPFAEGEQAQKRCQVCHVTVRTAYGGLCYRSCGSNVWRQSNSPHMEPCRGRKS